jgi:hypothetical protein
MPATATIARTPALCCSDDNDGNLHDQVLLGPGATNSDW